MGFSEYQKVQKSNSLNERKIYKALRNQSIEFVIDLSVKDLLFIFDFSQN